MEEEQTEYSFLNETLSTIFDEDHSFSTSFSSNHEEGADPLLQTHLEDLVNVNETSRDGFSLISSQVSTKKLSTPNQPCSDLSFDSPGDKMDEKFMFDLDPSRVIDKPEEEPLLHLYLSESDPEEETHDLELARTERDNVLCKNEQKRNIQGNDDVFQVLKRSCCPANCMKSFSIADLQFSREQLKNLKEYETRQFVMDTMRNLCNLEKHGSRYKLETKFIIRGKNICPKGWRLVYGVSDWKYRDCVSRIKSGKTSTSRMRKYRRGRRQDRTAAALAWMTQLFKKMGDYMPHRETVELPHSWTKRHLYERMLIEETLPLGRRPVISYEHFTRIWKKNLSQYVIAKTSDFTKCSTCTQLKDKYEKAGSDELRANISKLKQQHDKQIEAERRAYHEARDKARREPSEMTCIILDGMDQSKTNVPHFVVQDKDNGHLAKLPVHFTGVLIHTSSAEGKVPFIYHDIKHVPHDSNLTIHCLTEALCQVKDKLGKALFLQMDNCARENKNKYVLSYVSLLVHLEIFKEAYIHFLHVGHTHEDIDQMFSCISRQLKCHNAFTLQDLEREASVSYSPPIKVVPVTAVANVKAELQNHMAGHFKNHSKPLWFRFRKAEGETFMHYKLLVNDCWKPAADSDWPKGLSCLKTTPDLHAKLPWVEASLEKTDFEKLCQELPHAYNARLPPEAQEWWSTFLPVKIRSSYEEVPPAAKWPLLQLLKPTVTVDIVEDMECLESLQAHIEQTCPEVSVGMQGRMQKVHQVDNYSSVQMGMLAAVHCEETEGRPFIARVVAVHNEEFTVEWLRGSWTRSWHPWIVKQGKQRKTYSSVIPQNSLILWDFHLTQGGRLKQETIKELKKRYEELDAGQDQERMN